MRKATRRAFQFATLTCSCLLQCISIPTAPGSGADECIGRFFQVRREVKGVQEKNYAHQIALGFIGGMGLWLPVLLLVPMVGGTTMQLKHRAEADGIIQDWQERHCRHKSGDAGKDREIPPLET